MSRRGEAPGLIDAVAALLGTSLRALQSRLELAAFELGEARRRLIFGVVALLAVALLFCGAATALTVWVAVAFWDRLGPSVLGWIALVYALGGLALLYWMKAQLARGPGLLEDTLAELREDARMATGGDDASPS